MDAGSGSTQSGSFSREKSDVEWADMAQSWIGARQQHYAMSDPAFPPSSFAENRPSVSSLPRVYNSVSDVISYSYSPTKGNSYSAGVPMGTASLYAGHPTLLPTPTQRMVNCVRPVKSPYEPCMPGVPTAPVPNRCMSPRMARLSMPTTSVPPPVCFSMENYGPVPSGPPTTTQWTPAALGNAVLYPTQCSAERWCPPVAGWPPTVNHFDRQDQMYEQRMLSNSGLPLQYPIQCAVDASMSLPPPTAPICPTNEQPSFGYHTWGHSAYPGGVTLPIASAAGSAAINSVIPEQRKTLPNWIRDGLEKIEQEKRRSTDGSTEERNVENETQDDTGEAEEDSKSSKDFYARNEAETQQLLRTLQRQLTVILLEVTNSEVEAICERKFKEEKGKAQPKLLAQSSALASILHLGDDEDEQESSSEEGSSGDRSSERTKRSSPVFRAPLPPPPSKSTSSARKSKRENDNSRRDYETSSSRRKDQSDAKYHRSSNSFKHHHSSRNGLNHDDEVNDSHKAKRAKK
ncbi:hypothetical protein M514_07328 [Trichuris suis]|uniref:Uncharacterized protein n=1 Tax=Trichuris suis TaxID=68888 RepID=A0A085M3K5_9BILA|nr:hypothetical protein M513_07328 [Trichuris suis]KFD68344.1 hypothetical protein M514_07328 [Trichuris suis]